MMGSRLRAFYVPYRDAVALFLEQDGQMAVSANFMDLPAPGQQREALTHIDLTAAQGLMDDLWAAGLRPAAGKQSEGLVSATERHLADMRAIAFSKLNVERP
jgi:hypothetical protein